MQWVLRAGLAISVVLMAAGLAIGLVTGEHLSATVRLHALFSDGTFADRLIAGGLVILAATPVVRVVALVAIWIHERDRRFALAGLIVCAILATAILSGRGG